MPDLTGHWRALYENRYLGAWSLFAGGRYREVTARIDRVSYEEIVGPGGRKSRSLVLHLSGRKGPIPAPMILSKSNGTTLQLMFGEIPKNWEGKEITIYVQKSKRVMAGTGDVLKIRCTRGSDALREELEARAPDPATIPEEDLDDAETH